MKKALICGIQGQDGSYLAKYLLEKGYIVFGTSRDAQVSSFENLKHLKIRDEVQIYSMALNDFRSVLDILSNVKPDEIYNLAGQSSVGLSFEQPIETIESISGGTINLLEAIRFLRLEAKFYNAGSGECYGDTPEQGANENTPFQPRSPYAIAKASSSWLVNTYREAYKIFACNGILFNHESPFRPHRFVTRKIVSSAFRISRGSKERLSLGNVNLFRDFGWAPDYVDAMWRMLQCDTPDNYVIATGKASNLTEYLDLVFKTFNLDWHDYVDIDCTFVRPCEILYSCGDSTKANLQLQWQPKTDINGVVKKMCECEIRLAERCKDHPYSIYY